jgi:hypothetical protein
MTLLVVLGMHRSGTSALTGVLALLGFSSGENLLAPNEFNERGYFENSKLNEKLDALLHAMGTAWDDERANNGDLSGVALSRAAEEEVFLVLRECFDYSIPTVIKDPRICILLSRIQPFWDSINIKPKYIFSIRSPFAVIQSLARRDLMEPRRAALLYIKYLLDAELYTRGSPRLFVLYSDLVADWRREVGRILNFVESGAIKFNSDKIFNETLIEAFLSRDLDHSKGINECPEDVEIKMALEIYELFAAPLGNDSVRALDDIRSRWLSHLTNLDPWLREVGNLRRLRRDLPKSLFMPNPVLLTDASSNARSEIFWSTSSQPFSESTKLVANWSYNSDNNQRYVFPKFQGPLLQLRWDISDRPVLCLINRFWIEDSSGGVKWTWERGCDLFDQNSADMHILGLNKTDQLQLMVTGFDPYAKVCVPVDVLGQIEEGWSLRATWSAHLPNAVLHSLMRQFTEQRFDLLSKEQRLIACDEQLKFLLGRADEQAKSMAQMERQHVAVREEVIRAEAQLAALKEMWRGGDGVERV